AAQHMPASTHAIASTPGPASSTTPSPSPSREIPYSSTTASTTNTGATNTQPSKLVPDSRVTSPAYRDRTDRVPATKHDVAAALLVVAHQRPAAVPVHAVGHDRQRIADHRDGRQRHGHGVRRLSTVDDLIALARGQPVVVAVAELRLGHVAQHPKRDR